MGMAAFERMMKKWDVLAMYYGFCAGTFKRAWLAGSRDFMVYYHRGIPVGLQCFKFASLSFFPFGKEVRYGGGAGSLLLNIIWLFVSGLPLAAGLRNHGSDSLLYGDWNSLWTPAF